jgi:protein-arginine kinase activator protein McsA
MAVFDGLAEIKNDKLTGYKYNSDQIEVLGYISKGSSGSMYVVKCYKCAQDPELFGEALFTIHAANIHKGTVPCGCSPYRWTNEQYTLRAQRFSEAFRYKFVSCTIVDGKCMATLLCKEHGEYTTNIHNYLSGRGCRRCGKGNLKPDTEMIGNFKSSGVFDDATTFRRIERKDTKGGKVFWEVHCPRCLVTYEGSASHLKKGKQGCACSISNQKFSYLLQIYDSETPIAVKFGITKAPKRRLYEHSNCSSFSVEPIAYWRFSSNTLCKAAETECSRTFLCGVLSVTDFPDGYTETTSISNIDSIMSIFANHGGEIIYDHFQ